MSRFNLNPLFLLVLCVGCHGKLDLSKYFRSCDRDSPDLNDCLVDAIQEGVVNMADGIPEVDCPAIDPHIQKEIKVEYKTNQIEAKMTMKNIRTTGLKTAKVHDVRARIDDDKFYIEVDITSPNVVALGDYKAEGRYNAIHVNTKGSFNCSMWDLKYTWKLEGTPEVRGNETYCRITSFWMRPDVRDMRTYTSNVFPDNPELTELANNVVNQNWRLLYRELLPYAQDNWGRIGVKVANKIFLKVPYNELFPSSS